MAKKVRKQVKPEVEKEADFYDLKTDAVKALVEADESNSPEVSKEELAKYRSKSGLHLPQWLKMLLIKWWFAGSVCFFFIWGLGIYMADIYDTLLITAIGMGVVTDILTNNALRFMERTKGESDRWIMIRKRRYISFFLNILYAGLVLWFVYMLYTVINAAAAAISHNPDRIFLGVGPIMFGLFYLGFDLLFIEIRNWFVSVLKKS
ncbi:MAG: hypothetical protein IJM63_09000 [Solobacterium sp.]|nr:hypothetical protein [Solobacterium sp.]